MTRSKQALAALALLITTTAAAQQTTFRSNVELVTVTASVRDGNRVVSGLGAADFQIADNGVVQTVSRVDADTVPVDVTLVLDTSGSTDWVIERFRKRQAA